MAINTFTFGGVTSSDFGIYVSGEGLFNAPKRAAEVVSIPGRNGDFILDQGKFENIKVTYRVFNQEKDLADFRTKLADLRSALASQVGYQRLEDTFHPSEYRMAAFIEGVEIEPIKYNTASEFEITFECKPQRFLKSGETAVSVTSGDTITNPTRFDAQPKLDVYGYGDISFNGFKISIDDGFFGYVNPLINIGYPTATSFTLNLNGALYNVGDPITVSDLLNNTFGNGWQFMFAYGTGSSLILPATFVSKTESGAVTNSTWGNGTGLNSFKGGITAEFTAGTSASGYASAIYDVKSTDYTTVAGQITVTLTASYDASDETITIIASYVSNIANQNYKCTFANSDGMKASTIANSTKTYIGNPTYVDCEIGEAYKIEGGQVIPLNAYIDLGSELPTLASGANEITYDNTVTALEVTPKWWQV